MLANLGIVTKLLFLLKYLTLLKYSIVKRLYVNKIKRKIISKFCVCLTKVSSLDSSGQDFSVFNYLPCVLHVCFAHNMCSFKRFFRGLPEEEKAARRDYMHLLARLLSASTYNACKDIFKHICVLALSERVTDQLKQSVMHVDAIIEVPHAYDHLIEKAGADEERCPPNLHKESDFYGESKFKSDFEASNFKYTE